MSCITGFSNMYLGYNNEFIINTKNSKKLVIFNNKKWNKKGFLFVHVC